MSLENEDDHKDLEITKNKKPSKKKKDKLTNALQDQLSKSSMSEFISQVRNKKKASDTRASNEERGCICFGKINRKRTLSRPWGWRLTRIEQEKVDHFYRCSGLFEFCLFFNFCGTATLERNIYLSEKPIPVSDLSAFRGTASFQLGNPIYVHFSMEEALGANRIIIKIFSVEQNSENLIGEISATTKPHWKHIQTHFQKEFFEKRGRYKMQISRPNGDLLAGRSFLVR